MGLHCGCRCSAVGMMRSSRLIIVTNLIAAAKAYRAPGGKVLEKPEDRLHFWNSCRQ